MQKFRNNLITPELASKLIESQFDGEYILSGSPSDFSKEETKKSRKRRQKFHDEENKKLLHLLECIFQTEFWTDECDWSNSFDAYACRLRDGRIVIKVSIGFFSCHPFEEVDEDTLVPSFVDATRWAFYAADFFSQIKSSLFVVDCEDILVKAHYSLLDEEGFERFRSEFLNASLEVKKQ